MADEHISHTDRDLLILLHSDVSEIKQSMGDLPCGVHKYRIGLLSKVVFGAIGIICLAFFATFTDRSSAKDTTKVKQVVSQEQQKEEIK